MNQTLNESVGTLRSVPAPRRDNGRLFYAAAAGLMVLILLTGFRHFFFKGQSHPGREITPPIRTLIIVHGVSMSAWVLLFLGQSLLITTSRYRVHMLVGRIATVFAASILVSGLMLTVRSAQVMPPDFVLWGMTGKQFMTVPFFSILLFAGMVAFAVWHRRRPEIHRPMMLFATLNALGAATGRTDVFNQLYQGTAWERVFGPSLTMLVIGAVLVLAKWILTRSFDRWFAISYGAVLIVSLLMVQIARTDAWDRFAGFLLQ